jgi:hypothetical protein
LPPLRLTVEPGALRWRVRFPESTELTAKLLFETQEGALEIAAGERKRISVRVLPDRSD